MICPWRSAPVRPKMDKPVTSANTTALAHQRRHATDQRLTARATQLGFIDVQAYLADRLGVRAWPLAEVTAELGAHRVTVPAAAG